jgi:hypothetical protein
MRRSSVCPWCGHRYDRGHRRRIWELLELRSFAILKDDREEIAIIDAELFRCGMIPPANDNHARGD